MITRQDTLARARRVRLMAFDVDGVLSDGALYYTDSGEEIKAFSTVDGQGLNLLREAGITIAILTGRSTRSVENRMRYLGIELVFQGCKDKWATLQEILASRSLSADEAGFMGDDLIDLKVMAGCGFSAAPADAHETAHRYARLITTRPGGRGAVREVCDYLLAAQGQLDAVLARYLPDSER